MFKDIFLGAGLLLPLGFGQGPGLAFSIGNGYELNESLIDLGQQLTHGAALGATIASIGFIIGGVVGVIALNYFARKRNIVVSKIHKEDSTIRESFEVETIKEIQLDKLFISVIFNSEFL